MGRVLITDLVTFALLAVHIVYIVRALVRPNREPAARLAWVLVLIVVPVAGVIGYMLLGETYLGRGRRRLLAAVEQALPRPDPWTGSDSTLPDDRYAPPFQLARAVSRLAATRGNAASVLVDPAERLDQLENDIDAAQASVHLCFYIWLGDGTGQRLARALARAAQRGVAVRVLADGVGSRDFIASPLWKAMQAAGVQTRVALKVTSPVPRLLYRRIDLRNHRKAAIIDNAVAWFGSMNAADPEFRIKQAYGPWVDLMLRCTGPVARQAQYLFAADWMGERGDDLTSLLEAPPAAAQGGATMQVFGTGPTQHFGAMSECFAALAHCAARELVITTPYFVPDDALLSALISCARRGVGVTVILPEHNDSWLVAGASRSSYGALLEAGVGLHHYPDGLLHAKTVTVDGEIALVGSANMDRRSLDLNFENNVLVRSRELVGSIRASQQQWLAASWAVSPGEVARWGVSRRLWHSVLALLSPIL